MTMIHLETYEAFKAAGVPEAEAKAAAAASSGEFNLVRGELSKEVKSLRDEMRDMYNRIDGRFVKQGERLGQMEKQLTGMSVMLGIIMLAVVIPLLKNAF